MNLQQIEFLAHKFLELCQLHPEICPHNYEWQMTISDNNGIKEKHYICSLCGDEKIIYTYDGAGWSDSELLAHEEALRSKQRHEALKQSKKM